MRAALLVAAITLSGCAPVDACKYAQIRRATYTAAIRAADLYVLSGRPVPPAVALGREAASTALGILDNNCPVVKP